MTLIVGIEMMTIWTNLDWGEMERIEHRNMEDMLRDNCMEVDVEEAWDEIEMMVGMDYNTHYTKDDAKKSKDEDKVDLGSDDLPDLHGEHVGMELHVGAVGRETILVDN